MMDYEKGTVDQEVTDENIEFTKLLEDTARFADDYGRQIVKRLNDISDLMFKLKPPDAEFVYNTGILVGKLDQVAVTIHGYLSSYAKYRGAFVTSIAGSKEEMH